MSEEKTLLSPEEADKLLASADGRAALLYLHILRSGGFSLTAAARVLRCTETETAIAADTLRRLGLLQPPNRQPEPAEPPQVDAADIVLRAETDNAFGGLVTEAEKTLGRVLSAHDLQVLFGIYDHYGLPADVIMLLLHHCVEEYQARSGPGRMPSMRYIEKEGAHWAEQEIWSLDAAEEHLRVYRQRQMAAAKIGETLQIRGRELTATERKYIESWLALGFGADAIAVAYDRTVLRTGKLQWRYMDSILRRWSDKGLFTAEAIEAGDPMQRTKRAAAPATEDSKKQIEDLRKLYTSMNKGKKEG